MNLKSEQQRLFIDTVMAYHLQPYDWGGQGLGGVDCSGLIVEGLRAVGLLGSSQDMTANTMWNTWRGDFPAIKPRLGCLIFWFNANGKAIHTAMGVGPYHCIGAHGGGSGVVDFDSADKADAFVKIRPIDYRNETYKIIYLFQ